MLCYVSLKIGLPEHLDGSLDLDMLESFLFTVEQYFELSSLDDDN